MKMTKKDSSVSVWLRQPHQAHCNGVTSFATEPGFLYSGSRDASIRKWAVNGLTIEHVSVFEGHSDWVNDIVLDAASRLLISTGNDTSVRMWNADTLQSVSILRKHTDYVRTLSYNSDKHQLVSSGVDCGVFMWDVVRADSDPIVFKGKTDSVYCTALSADGNMLATGGADHSLRLWDTREAAKIVTLRGHEESVRAVLLGGDGQLAVTAASDRTVRVWDIGTRRCVRTLRAFADSVWTLTASRDLRHVLAGSRDGRAIAIDVHAGTATGVFREQGGLVRLHLDGDSVWASTVAPTIRQWSAAPGMGQLQCESPRAAVVEEAETLADRVHVLTRDNAGTIAMWNVLAGAVEAEFQGVTLQEKVKELQPLATTPQWFNTRINTGFLAIDLRANRCLQSESYAVDVGLDAENDLVKVNLGERLLNSVFWYWKKGKEQLDAKPRQDSPTVDGGAERVAALTPSPVPERAGPPFTPYPASTPVVLVDSNSAPLLWRTVGGLTGCEDDAVIPMFVSELLLFNRAPAPDVTKIQFTLLPVSGSQLPELPHGKQKLSAPRLLRMHRAIAYVADKIAAVLVTPPASGPPSSPTQGSQGSPAGTPIGAHEQLDSATLCAELELMCGESDKPLDHGLTLGAVRTHLSKGGGDLVLRYRRKGEFQTMQM